MTQLVPFNRKNTGVARVGTNFEDFYNMLDDFFADGFTQNRNLLRDTFKIDIKDNGAEYVIEAEMPGVKKEDINLSVEDENLCITVDRTEETNEDGQNYIHRERRYSSMSRRVRLAGARLDDIKAKLDEGVLSIAVPKVIKSESSRKIDIE